MDLVQVDRCASIAPWWELKIASHSDPYRQYTVLIPFPEDPPSEFICECLGYIHRGYCRHQEEAAQLLCHWEEKDGPECQTDDQKLHFICPRCLGPTLRTAEWV